MTNKVVLIVDDDEKIADLLKTYFENDGFKVMVERDGPAGLLAIKNKKPDIVILDVMLPGMNGFDVLKHVRKDDNVPIIMLTARSEEGDKLVGLEVGADDYIAKPFSPKEVVARAKAVIRRVKGDAGTAVEFKVGKLSVDTKKHEVLKDGKVVDITPIEFKILELLCQNPGHVMSRLQIIERVQGYEFEGYERTVDAHIKNIRKKIETDPQDPKYLLTVYGVGYKLVSPDKK